MPRAPLLLLIALAALDPAARAQGPIDSAYMHVPVKGPLKLRAIGGIAGVLRESYDPMDLHRFTQFAREAVPLPPGDPVRYWFSRSTSSFGASIGPRAALARLRDGRNGEQGWTLHLGIQPRVFMLLLHTDSLLGDTARTVDYVYSISQMEVTLGGGPYWSLFLTDRFYLRPGLLAEVGHAASGSLTASGTRTDEARGSTWETTLMDRTVPARACTWLRAHACLAAGLRIRRRVDLGLRAQWGTGLLWLHGVDVTPLRAAALYALDAAFLIKR